MNRLPLGRMKRLFAVSGLILAIAGGIHAAPPTWWSEGDPPVIDPQAAPNNHGVANIGQAKWMAKNALEALRAKRPDLATLVEADLVGSGKPIASWAAPVTAEQQTQQRQPLLIGQLKAIAAPFYDRLQAADSAWLAAQATENGIPNTGSHYPWTATTDDDSNKAMATIGQLKAVFSLRFENLSAAADSQVSDGDEDGLPDAWEIMHGLDPDDNSGNNGWDGDFDDDGVSNADELEGNSAPNNAEDFPVRVIQISKSVWGSSNYTARQPPQQPYLGYWYGGPWWTSAWHEDVVEDGAITPAYLEPILEGMAFPALPPTPLQQSWQSNLSRLGPIHAHCSVNRPPEGNGIESGLTSTRVWIKAPASPATRTFSFVKVRDYTAYVHPTASNPTHTHTTTFVSAEVVTATIPANQAISNPIDLKYLGPIIDGCDVMAYESLLPVEIVPDWDRDGKIDNTDRGKVASGDPFVFWVNDDDDDNSEAHFGDIPENQTDGVDVMVNSKRDLVDFFPVQLRFSQLLWAFPSREYSYKIIHPTGAFHFIEMPNVHPDSNPEAQGAGSYLRNSTIGDEALSRPMLDTAGQGAELSMEFLSAAIENRGVLLFEAKSATNQSFELVIVKKDNGQEVARISRALPVEMEEVEKMYWRANIRSAAYGQQVGANVVVEPTNSKFKSSRKDRWFVFCHGYNVNEKAARGWNSEIFKRLHQMGSDSKFLGVTWEGNQGQIDPWIPFAGGATPDYWQNVYNAFQSSASLATVVNGLSSGPRVVAGHSLGNMLVSSAVCDKNLEAEQYFMINAAVPREAYSVAHISQDRFLVRNPSWNQYDNQTRLWSSDYWNLFPTSDGRHNLTWRGRFSALGSKTTPFNYFSTGEEVLKKGNSTKPNLFLDVTIKSQLAWVKQEMGKGEVTKKLVTGVRASNGGWGYNAFWGGNPPVDNDVLRANPYFKPFTDFGINGQFQSIHGGNGSDLAKQYWVRAFLLAHDIPAISNPAGSDFVQGYAGGDMNSKWKSGSWGDWKHSDIKNQSFDRVWRVYADMVKRGSLNKGLAPAATN
jgi:hypothetical protein